MPEQEIERTKAWCPICRAAVSGLADRMFAKARKCPKCRNLVFFEHERPSSVIVDLKKEQRAGGGQEDSEEGMEEWLDAHILSDSIIVGMIGRWEERNQSTIKILWMWAILSIIGIIAQVFIEDINIKLLLLIIPLLIIINIGRNLGTLLSIGGQLLYQLHNSNKLQVRSLSQAMKASKEKEK
ncbi:MAG: hypothetical protein JXA52_02110 [Planctomycetes bacterium]|nr:hypothetical protein [Planctomycetota bacterium]